MRVKEPRTLNIKNWSPEDRPREKLLLKGTPALSDTELIAILLRSGATTVSAVELARRILQTVNNNLHDLARLSVKDLMQIKGIGEAKALTIIAALELGRRRKETDADEKPVIIRSEEAYDVMKPHLQDLRHEEFWVILLNRGSRMIGKKLVSQGGVDGTVADPKIIFKVALEALATSIILVHNHPSGNPSASRKDRELTRKFQEGGRLLDILVADHIIITDTGYLSFADEGLL